MAIDTAAILAAQYRNNPRALQAAVLGEGESSINPYAALRALQLQKEAQHYEMMQAAARGQQAQQQPSMVDQALAPAGPDEMTAMQLGGGMPSLMTGEQDTGAGLEAMPIPDQEFAGGGIVAFADGDVVEAPTYTEEDKEDSPGSPVAYNTFAQMLPGLMKQVAGQQYVEQTPEQYETNFQNRLELLQRNAGVSPIAGMEEKIAKLDEERKAGLEQGKGLAMLSAASAMLQPGGFMRGLGAAGSAFASEYGKAMAADKAEQRSLMSMQFNLADAKRKEQMGLNREAIAAADQARLDHAAAQKFKLEKAKSLANLAISGARATKPTGAGAGGPKNFDALAQAYYEEAKYANEQLPENKRKPDAVVKKLAFKEAAADWAKLPAGEVIPIKKGELGVKSREADIQEERARTEKTKVATEQGTKVNEALTKWSRSREAIEAKRDGTYEDKRQAKVAELRSQYPDALTWQGGAKPAPAAGNKNSQSPAGGGKVITQADVDATVKARATQRNISEADARKEVLNALKQKGYTVK